MFTRPQAPTATLGESSLRPSSALGLPKGQPQPLCSQPAPAAISACPCTPQGGLLTRPPGCCLQVNREHRGFLLHPPVRDSGKQSESLQDSIRERDLPPRPPRWEGRLRGGPGGHGSPFSEHLWGEPGG